jgi:hypothetical protein
MASLTYNLKKYMRFVRKQPNCIAQAAVQKQGFLAKKNSFWASTARF